MRRHLFPLVIALSCSGAAGPGPGRVSSGGTAMPAAHVVPVDPPFRGEVGTILFVTQVPVGGFATLTSTFGNHRTEEERAPRGGGLMIRYPDGALRNLTREAGFGRVAVRQPSVHWSGNKAIFSMLVDGSHEDLGNGRWQLFEVTGIGRSEHVAVTRVQKQPAAFNNVAPVYATDDRIIFVSDRPRSGEAHLYPQIDEYESQPTNTGLWRLDPLNPASGELILLEHAPSGAFNPLVDGFGRVVFTKWDHLQRDQQVHWDERNPAAAYGAFTFSDESAAATRLTSLVGVETYPEQHDPADPGAIARTNALRFNQFLPWEINEDGTGEETLNHVGRHEIGGTYTEGSFADDPNLTYARVASAHKNRFYMNDGGLFQLREDPRALGTFYGTYSSEFETPTAGVLVKLNGAPDVNPEDMILTPLTDPGASFDRAGFYRSPLPLSSGALVAAYSPTGGNQPKSLRLTLLRRTKKYFQADRPLTPGLADGQRALWELDPVEVAARPRPAARHALMEEPEESVFRAEGVDVAVLRAWLASRELAVIVSRNVTLRDRGELQQPFNLRIPGGVENVPAAGKVYDVAFLQVFQGDALRGYGVKEPVPGRRLIAKPIHGPDIFDPPPGAPAGSVKIAADGSVAAIVPARRALSWQLLSPTGRAVVRERNWVSFQAGEIRGCPACHGINRESHGRVRNPTQPPLALRDLLRAWKSLTK